jgi:pyruvate formate lyase activating enzyme
MVIKGYLPTSVIEWPGKISAVIFTSGCNFRCPYCHNADLVDPARLNRLPQILEKKILADLIKRKKWLDAVVITGGEPTLQPDLENFIKKVKQMGFLTMLETNGSKPDTIARLLDSHIVDRFAVDIKGPLDSNYARITRYKDIKISGEIEKSLKAIIENGVDCELRTTVVPGIHDQAVLVRMAKQIKKISKNCYWFLQNFQPNRCLDPKFNKIKPFSSLDLQKFQKSLQKIIPRVKLREN